MGNKVVVIAGMHRSGTSLASRVLQNAGVNIGADLLPPADDNKFGFFEDRGFQEFHENVMQRCGYDYLLTDDSKLAFNNDEIDYAGKLADARSELDVWGWKDPRTSLFLKEWDGILADAKYFFVFRPPHEVVMSLINRAGPRALRKMDHLFDVWRLYNSRIYEFYKSNSDRTLLCNIHGLLDNQDGFASLLESRLGLKKRPDINSLFDSGLLNNITLPEWADTYIRNTHPDVMSLYDKMQNDCDIPLTNNSPVDELEFTADIMSLFNNVNKKWIENTDNITAGNQHAAGVNRIDLEEKYHELLNSKPVRFSRFIKKNKFLYRAAKSVFTMAEFGYINTGSKDKKKTNIDNKGSSVILSSVKKIDSDDKLLINAEVDREYAHINKNFDHVLHVYYKGMHGVQSAVSYLPGAKVGIPINKSLPPKELAKLLTFIAENSIEHLVMHGYSHGCSNLIKKLKSEIPLLKIYSIWHGGPSQFSDDVVYSSFEALWAMKRAGDLDQIANVKVGMASFSADIFPDIVYNFPPNVECVGRISFEKNSVLVPLREIYRKNLHSNILAAVSSDDIDKVYTTVNIPSFNGKLPMEKICVVNNDASLSRKEMFSLYSDVGMVLNVTLAECQPMVMLEALAHASPCLIGPNSFGELDGHEYKKLIEVVRPDVLPEILTAISRVKSLQDTDASGLEEMMQDYKQQTCQLAELSYAKLFDS